MNTPEHNEEPTQESIGEQFNVLETLLKDEPVRILGDSIKTQTYFIAYEPDNALRSQPDVVTRQQIFIAVKDRPDSLGYFAKETSKDGTVTYMFGNSEVLEMPNDSATVIINKLSAAEDKTTIAEALPMLVKRITTEIRALLPDIEITEAIRARMVQYLNGTLPSGSGIYVDQEC